jgi:hypothetical protein
MHWVEIYVQIVFLLTTLYIEEHLPIPPLKTFTSQIHNRNNAILFLLYILQPAAYSLFSHSAYIFQYEA